MKPFREQELLARVRVAIRRHGLRESTDPFTIGDLRVNPAERRVFVSGVEVHLTATEYKLLAVLVRQAGRVVTHQQLLREVWGPAYEREVQYLRVYMKQLRYKLEKEPAQPQCLLTSPGVGYRLKVDDCLRGYLSWANARRAASSNERRWCWGKYPQNSGELEIRSVESPSTSWRATNSLRR